LLVAALLGVVALDARLGAVAWAGVRLPPGVVLLAIGLLAGGWGAWELGPLCGAPSGPAPRVLFVAAALIGQGAMFLGPPGGVASAVGAVAVAVLGLGVRCGPRHGASGAAATAGVALLALVLLGALPGFWLLLRRAEGAWLVAGVVLVVKACDIGAYTIGRLLGRAALVPWLSPGKTWEGLIGGLLSAGALAALLAGLSGDLDPEIAAAGGLLLGLVGQAGDLTVSALKRDAGAKDTGVGVRGFGGMLDVMDALLLAGPVAYGLLAAAG
jgi:phosphatidate cytidylyltransferase